MKPVLSKPINSVQDMLESDSQLIVPSPTTIVTLLNLDPRSDVQQLNKTHLKMPIKKFFSRTTKERFGFSRVIVVRINITNVTA